MKKWQDYRKRDRAWRWQDVYHNVNRDLKRHAAKAGIKVKQGKQFSVHTLRKCAGKNWATVNNDPKVTQVLMGHRNYKTTMKYYSDVTAEDRARATAKIEALLKTG